MRICLTIIGLVFITNLYSQKIDSTGLHFFGNVDTYWRYSFNKTPSITSMVFDHNSFSMGWLSLGMQRDGKKTGFVSNVAFGPRSVQFYGGGNNPLGYLRDLNFYWKISPKLKTTFGITQPFIGYEADEPHLNLNYSGSYNYSFLPPAAIAGLQFEYQVDENWGLLAGIYNSTLTLIDDNENKFIGGQVIFENEVVSSMRLGAIYGTEGDDSKVFILEWVGDFDISEKFFLGSNFLYQNQQFATDGSADWYMFNLYGGYKLKENLTFALRGEYMGDPDGALLNITENGITSFTATLSWQIENLKISPEIRFDNSNHPTFVNNAQKLINTEGHFMIGVMYAF